MRHSAKSITADKIIGIFGIGLQGSFNPQKIIEEIQELMTKRENEFEEYLQKNIGQLENYMILLKGAMDGDVDYRYISESTGACDLCDGLNGQSFKMINAKAGINYPPIHPNCKCRVTALKFGSIVGYSHQPEDIVNNLNKMLDNLPYIDKDVERIGQKNNDEDTLPTLTYPDYYTEYGSFYEFPWVKTAPPTEPVTKEEDYDIEPFIKIPLEERTKWPYQGYEDIVFNNTINEFKDSCAINAYYDDIAEILNDINENNKEILQAIKDINSVESIINAEPRHTVKNSKYVIDLYAVARLLQIESGIPAAIIVGQAIWETGFWGINVKVDKDTGISSNNLFNIEAYPNVRPNEPYITAKNGRVWRSFDNVIDSVYALTHLLNVQYREYLKEDTVEGWAQALVDGNFCSGNYSKAILDRIDEWGLK